MGNPDSTLQEHRLLGFFTHPGTLDEYLNLLKTSIENRDPCTIFYHNLHSIYSYFSSESLRKCYENTTVLIDGVPVIWLYKIFGFPLTRAQRVTYVDFIFPMMELARENDWQVYHIGQNANVQQKAMQVIRERVPGIKIDGRDGFFDQTPQCNESLEVVKNINDSGAEILLVGFGAPRQEEWLRAHRDQINASAVLTCGACMEYVAGEVGTPPRWMAKFGIEWMYRLFGNPKRFAHRYLIEPIFLAGILFRNWIGERFGGQAEK